MVTLGIGGWVGALVFVYMVRGLVGGWLAGWLGDRVAGLPVVPPPLVLQVPRALRISLVAYDGVRACWGGLLISITTETRVKQGKQQQLVVPNPQTKLATSRSGRESASL